MILEPANEDVDERRLMLMSNLTQPRKNIEEGKLRFWCSNQLARPTKKKYRRENGSARVLVLEPSQPMKKSY